MQRFMGRGGNRGNMTTLTDGAFECVYRDPDCSEKTGETCVRTERCQRPPSDGDMKDACIVVWTNDAKEKDGKRVLLQQCFMAQEKDPLPKLCGEERCVAHSPGPKDNSTFMCCCLQSNCNGKFFYEPKAQPEATPRPGNNPAVTHSSVHNEITSTLLYAFLPICLIAILIAFAYGIYRRYRLRRIQREERDGYKRSVSKSSSPLKPIKLEEIVKKGRYGIIWRARLYDKETVAVKVFPAHDVASWMQEREIYATPRMKEHANILTFFDAEVRGVGRDAEYWLITEYHEHGSMHDFLKRNKLDVVEALRLAVSMLRGLTFLHEEILGTELTYKPTIVHRDFKSKNVLIKNDMTACIADFGLAIKCIHGRAPGDVQHEQVGTRRYMAPEVLEGATDFNATAFRQIDVYACGLVLWELFSRTCFSGEPVDEYRLPFEEYVGLKPTLQELQKLVAEEKRRPSFKNECREHPQGSLICTTVEEMWDPETEARISAGCALERLSAALSLISASSTPSSVENRTSDTTPLISDYNSNLTMVVTDTPLPQPVPNVENV